MNLERLRKQCLSFPGATDQIQWGSNLVFKVGGRIFAIAATEPGGHQLSFKCSDEAFAELVEQEGIDPAPYLARAKWVALERFDALGDREIEARISEAYRIVFQKLTKSQQAAIGKGRVTRRSPARNKR